MFLIVVPATIHSFSPCDVNSTAWIRKLGEAVRILALRHAVREFHVILLLVRIFKIADGNFAGAPNFLHGGRRIERNKPLRPRSRRDARTAALMAKNTLFASTSGGSPTSFDENRFRWGSRARPRDVAREQMHVHLQRNRGDCRRSCSARCSRCSGGPSPRHPASNTSFSVSR